MKDHTQHNAEQIKNHAFKAMDTAQRRPPPPERHLSQSWRNHWQCNWEGTNFEDKYGKRELEDKPPSRIDPHHLNNLKMHIALWVDFGLRNAEHYRFPEDWYRKIESTAHLLENPATPHAAEMRLLNIGLTAAAEKMPLALAKKSQSHPKNFASRINSATDAPTLSL